MENQEVAETLKAATFYMKRLQLLNKELEAAMKQIITTFEETQTNIKETFKNLTTKVINSLNQRERYLMDQVERIKSEGILPLEECRQVIHSKIEFTNKLFNVKDSSKSYSVEEFMKNSRLLGSLPEVPELKDVPYISFCYDTAHEMEIEDRLENLGYVCRIAPVQITEFREKPGSIEVLWHNVDDEHLTDVQEYRVQKAIGDITKEKHILANFKDCYIGMDTEFLAKDLQILQPYSFRVCCRFEGTSEWSPWSLPQAFFTTLKCYNWKENNDFVLSNENRIATPVKENPSILLSDGAHFLVGHSVEFTFLEVDSSEMTIGLIQDNMLGKLKDLLLLKDGSFLLCQSGKIFIDGHEKLTILPKLFIGAKVVFTCDLMNEGKVRVHIDSSDKRVTYDWQIDLDPQLCFVAQFASSKWKVMIE